MFIFFLFFFSKFFFSKINFNKPILDLNIICSFTLSELVLFFPIVRSGMLWSPIKRSNAEDLNPLGTKLLSYGLILYYCSVRYFDQTWFQRIIPSNCVVMSWNKMQGDNFVFFRLVTESRIVSPFNWELIIDSLTSPLWLCPWKMLSTSNYKVPNLP